MPLAPLKKASYSIFVQMGNYSTKQDYVLRPKSAGVRYPTFSLPTRRCYDRLASACADFSLAISLKKAKVMHLGSEIAPTLSINDFILDVVPQFTYLGSTISANGFLDAELGKRIGKAATTMTKLSFRVWENKKLSTSTKIAIYCKSRNTNGLQLSE